MQVFPAAVWPKSLKVASTLSVVVILGVGYAAWKAVPPYGLAHVLVSLAACVPPAIGFVAALFMVRGYELDGGGLHIHRLLWATSIDLKGLKQVRHDPEAMKSSIRLFGNGGFFAITGVFQNKKLGRYRAFATNPEHSVVLVLPNRTLVVSPADPQGFVRRVQMLHPVRFQETGGMTPGS